MEMTTITYLNKVGTSANHSGLWRRVDGGIVLIHTRASQTFIPYSRILMMEQTITGSDMEPYEVRNKQLSNVLRSN